MPSPIFEQNEIKKNSSLILIIAGLITLLAGLGGVLPLLMDAQGSVAGLITGIAFWFLSFLCFKEVFLRARTPTKK